MALNAGRLIIESINERYTCGHFGGVFIIVWRESATAADFLDIDRMVGDLARDRRDGIGVLVILEPGNTRPPAAPARAALAQMTATHKKDIKGIATVLLGATIKHTMIRFVLSTLQLMSPSEVAQETFDSVTGAARWLQGRVKSASSLDIQKHAEYMREQAAPSRAKAG